tara:strand:- start:3328 stop:4524 length:1197 start_codon:yes stop_codon:yes gene_type:complete
MNYNNIKNYRVGGRAGRRILASSYFDTQARMAEEDARKAAEAYEKKSKLSKGLGDIWSKGAGLLTKSLAGDGLVGSLAQAYSKGYGQFMGETLGDVLTGKPKDVKRRTAFFADDFDDVDKLYKEQFGFSKDSMKNRLGRSLGKSGASLVGSATDYLGDVTKGKLANLFTGSGDTFSTIQPPSEGERYAQGLEMGEAGEGLRFGRGDSFGNFSLAQPQQLTDPRVLPSASDSMINVGSGSFSMSPQLLEDDKFFGLDDVNLDYAEGSIPSSFSPDSPSLQELASRGDETLFSDLGLDEIGKVSSPSLIGEEYALARDSNNMYNQMKELSRNLGVDIARQEGRLGQVLGNQEMRRPMFEDISPSNVQPVYNYFKPPMRGIGGGYQEGGLINPMSYARRIV